jgi:hypothetical protein
MFHWLTSLFDGRQERRQWEAGLTWFRLRYLDSAKTTRCINLLSRPDACGRVALYYRPGETVSRLHLGLPAAHGRLLQRMAADFGFSLQPAADLERPSIEPLTAVTELPWERPFMAQVVNGQPFVSDNGPKTTHFWAPANGQGGRATWQLPDKPSPGLTMQPSWNGEAPPAHLVASGPDPRCWLLGRSRTGAPLHVAGGVNLYGRQEAAAEWLTHQVTHTLAVNPANLVVIDGAGDLAPRLKRRAAVTRLMGEQLAYIDLDSDSLANGFNPLAAAPAETGEETMRRWQRWFQGMGVHPQALPWLEQARQEGAGDVIALQKWLRKMERAGRHTAARLNLSHASGQALSSLSLALNRLTAERTLREWLEWPANRFKILPAGALFFACRGTGWARRQLLRAVLLAAVQVKEARLVVHGFPWSAAGANLLPAERPVVLSNGPLLAESTVLLVESQAPAAAALARRFSGDDPRMTEWLQLLGSGEAFLVTGKQAYPVSWHQNGAGRSAGQVTTLPAKAGSFSENA